MVFRKHKEDSIWPRESKAGFHGIASQDPKALVPPYKAKLNIFSENVLYFQRKWLFYTDEIGDTARVCWLLLP
jgi:hypothetical protein